jgi:hypothetical protein
MAVSGTELKGGWRMSDEEDDTYDDLPLPPIPPGLSIPPPPQPPSSLDMDIPEIPPMPTPPPPPGISLPENETFLSSDSIEAEDDDFKSAWERRKSENPAFATEKRDQMYGHIDRIATGEVGTLLDRFSDRFGSELDREIIVLRKKQQQDMRDIKPTVELISPPDEEYEEEDEEESFEEDSAGEDNFAEFFAVVNDLLGGMPDDFVQSFVTSDDFPLFELVGSDPEGTSEDDRNSFFLMINRVLGELPDDMVKEFVQSPGFGVFQEMGTIYGE